MIKFNLIIGEPASGKSTYMRNLISSLGRKAEDYEVAELEYPLVKMQVYPETNTIVLGIYDEQLFSGTDRLSKAAGPKVREWLSLLSEDPYYDNWEVWAEGERLTNNPTILFSIDHPKIEFTLYVKEVDQETLESRRKARGSDNQNEKFLKGMKTRISNLKRKYEYIEIS